MRVLFCKINFSCFICFCCKPSSGLKLQVAAGDSNIDPDQSVAKEESIKEKKHDDDDDQICPRSCIKKTDDHQKKSVQWMDLLGKELVEIREFEPTQSKENDDEAGAHRGCGCTML